ncbi:MAG: hypothetical protein IT292_07535 [Deltaproteobacteria bacterium]|nr:hypothetical protein [Deltaproteobacteria bacterium]
MMSSMFAWRFVCGFCEEGDFMSWGIWVVAGFVIAILEVVVPIGFIFCLIGLAAVVTGLVVLSGLLPCMTMQWGLFAILSIVLLLVLKGPLTRYLLLSKKDTGSEITSDRVEIEEDILPGQIGKGKARGTVWNVKNDTDGKLERGKVYPVKGNDGLTLVVTKL